MHIVKKIFSATTGYWIHKITTLPVGADLFIDIHKRIKYGSLTTIFDVGANIGQTWEMLRKNEPQSKIYCFEPISAPFQKLKEKIKNDKKGIAENIALGEVPGDKIVRIHEDYSYLNSLKDELMNHDRNAPEERIKIETLDNYCSKERISLIDILKIDTEGYEMSVLKGGEGMLANGDISMIFCETGFSHQDNRHTNFSRLTEWLESKNYYFFSLYQVNLNGWKTKDSFANALYVRKDIFTP